jgi:diacylglycerol kinase family enzyme
MSRCIFLLNRSAGAVQRGLDLPSVCQVVEAAFRQAGHEITSSIVSPGGLESELEKIISSHPDVILIGGGDGSVSAAANQIRGTAIAMGIIPTGTFNLAARDFGIPLEIENAAEFLATSETVAVDVLDVSGQTCLCTTILGFYPEFAGFFERRDHGGYWWRKALKLLANLRKAFLSARPLFLSWSSDGGSGQARTKFTAIVPGRYKDHAGLIPERGEFHSGTFTAYFGTQNTAGSAMRGMLDYLLGRQEENPEVLVVRASHMELNASRRTSCRVMLDGEILRMRFPIRFSILPSHLHVLADSSKLKEPALQPP